MVLVNVFLEHDILMQDHSIRKSVLEEYRGVVEALCSFSESSVEIQLDLFLDRETLDLFRSMSEDDRKRALQASFQISYPESMANAYDCLVQLVSLPSLGLKRFVLTMFKWIAANHDPAMAFLALDHSFESPTEIALRLRNAFGCTKSVEINGDMGLKVTDRNADDEDEEIVCFPTYIDNYCDMKVPWSPVESDGLLLFWNVAHELSSGRKLRAINLASANVHVLERILRHVDLERYSLSSTILHSVVRRFNDSFDFLLSRGTLLDHGHAFKLATRYGNRHVLEYVISSTKIQTSLLIGKSRLCVFPVETIDFFSSLDYVSIDDDDEDGRHYPVSNLKEKLLFELIEKRDFSVELAQRIFGNDKEALLAAVLRRKGSILESVFNSSRKCDSFNKDYNFANVMDLFRFLFSGEDLEAILVEVAKSAVQDVGLADEEDHALSCLRSVEPYFGRSAEVRLEQVAVIGIEGKLRLFEYLFEHGLVEDFDESKEYCPILIAMNGSFKVFDPESIRVVVERFYGPGRTRKLCFDSHDYFESIECVQILAFLVKECGFEVSFEKDYPPCFSIEHQDLGGVEELVAACEEIGKKEDEFFVRLFPRFGKLPTVESCVKAFSVIKDSKRVVVFDRFHNLVGVLCDLVSNERFDLFAFVFEELVVKQRGEILEVVREATCLNDEEEKILCRDGSLIEGTDFISMIELMKSVRDSCFHVRMDGTRLVRDDLLDFVRSYLPHFEFDDLNENDDRLNHNEMFVSPRHWDLDPEALLSRCNDFLRHPWMDPSMRCVDYVKELLDRNNVVVDDKVLDRLSEDIDHVCVSDALDRAFRSRSSFSSSSSLVLD